MKEKKKGITLQLVLFIICAVVLIVTGVLCGHRLNATLKNINRDNIKNMTIQNKKSINYRLTSEMKHLEEVAQRCTSVYVKSTEEEIRQDLLISVKNYDFVRIGIADLDANVWTTDGLEYQLNTTKHQWFSHASQGKSYISPVLMDDQDKESIVVFSTPIYNNLHTKDKVEAVLFASYPLEKICDMLDLTFFDAKGELYVVQYDGAILLSSSSVYDAGNQKNIFNELVRYGNKEEVSMMVSDMHAGRTNACEISGEYDTLFAYTPLDINNWYLVSTVPVSAVNTHQKDIFVILSIVIVELIAMYVAFSLLVVRNQKEKNKELYDLLYVDQLTGCNTYMKFRMDAKALLASKKYRPMMFVEFDIDNFKLVNDFASFEMGNRVIKYISDVIAKHIRPGEMYGHCAGDEFVALLEWEGEEKAAERFDLFMSDILNHGMPLGDVSLVPSLGIYVLENFDEPYHVVRNNAKLAKYAIKNKELKWCSYYNSEMRREIENETHVRSEIRQAYENSEFYPYFQPKYDAKTKKLEGAEALVRWIKDDGKVIPPGVFVPVAERSEQIIAIDEMVFTKTCAQIRQWLDEGLEMVPVSVNVSRRQFYSDNFVQKYYDILCSYDLDAKYIQLEITESLACEDQKVFTEIMVKLQQYGFKLLVDDFGTGYSSLSLISRLPVDGIKLDKSFIDNAGTNAGKVTVCSIIDMAKKLSMEVTAEGVEYEDDYVFLKENGCELIQGYYFSRPIPTSEFHDLLK